MVLFGVLAISCEKDNSAPDKDEIVYNDIVPDKEIQTIIFYTFQDHAICTANVPTPSDSVVLYDLDLNKDQVADFRIRVAHSLYTDGYCGHCDKFTYNISIQGLSENDSVASSDSQFPPIPKIFNESDTIDKNNPWLSRADILLLEGCLLPFQTDFENGFIGVKIKNSYGYIYIEKMINNGIRILEHGFNKTENSIIKCGQK